MTPLLSIIIPVYKEARTIDELLARVLEAPLTPALSQGERGKGKQIIVVNDGSTDGTADRLEVWREGITLAEHPANLGKGTAIRTALQFADGQFTIIQDADLEYDPQDYSKLLQPMLNREADVVYGARQLRTRSLFRFGVSVLNRFARLLYGVKLTDEATCYKVFRTEDLRRMKLECERFEFCPEVTAKACRMGLRIVEVPISYRPRLAKDGKKIRFRDGWSAIKTLWKYRRWRVCEPLMHERTAVHVGVQGHEPVVCLTPVELQAMPISASVGSVARSRDAATMR